MKNGKKKIQNQAGNSASWTQVREFNLINIIFTSVCHCMAIDIH